MTIAPQPLDLPDRPPNQRQCLVLARAQKVKRKPLRGTAAHAGQLRELADQPLYRRGVHVRGGLQAGQAQAAEAAAGDASELRGRELLSRAQRLVDGGQHHVLE